MKKLKNETAITLIALIITVIILIILAGVSLNAIAGDDGLIAKSMQAKEETEDADFKVNAESIIFEAAEMREEGASEDEIKEFLKEKFSALDSNTIISRLRKSIFYYMWK
jgi:hypothetical protein